MRTQRTEIRAHREPWVSDSIAIRIARIVENLDGTATVGLAEPMTFKTLSKEEELMPVEIPATMVVSPEDAKQLMDELWRIGVRPSDGTGSVGQLGAVKDHLEDMRALVFRKEPGKSLPKQPLT